MKRIVVCAVLSLVSVARSARAGDVEACAEAHRAAQRDRRDGHLVQAKRSLLVCGQASCPALIRRDCADWLVAVDRELPTVVIEPKDEAGDLVQGASLYVDEDSSSVALEGKAIPIDPGAHRLRVEVAGREPAAKSAVVVEGVKAQRVVVRVGPKIAPPARAPAPSGEDKPSRPGSLVVTGSLAAVGLVGVSLFTGFGLAGQSIKGDLDDSGCRPQCEPAKVDEMWRDFTIADVSLGLGLAALTAAAVHFVLTH